MSASKQANEISLLISRTFMPVWAGYPDCDQELIFRVEEAQLAANGNNPDVRDALHGAMRSFSGLFNAVGRIHMLQIAVEQEAKTGVSLAETLNELSQLFQTETDLVRSELLAWGTDSGCRYEQVAPHIFAASDLFGQVDTEINRLQAKISSSAADRHRSEQQYHSAGLSSEQIGMLKPKPTFEEVEDWRFEVKGLETKRRLLESFLSDAPRYRIEKLQGVELPGLFARQEQQHRQKQAKQKTR